MSTIVSKFGGSSIADADGFCRVREIVTSQKRRRYIILSAPGKRFADDEKITDLLVRSHQMYASGQDGAGPLNIVKERFTSIIRRLRLDTNPTDLLSDLESDVQHSRDRAASRGEYFCARLFAIHAGLPFVDATELIHFDKNGRIQRDEIARAICAMADHFPCAVIPGFYGSLPDGSIKTFTRGGSDITGALVAAALNADVYENWTDVDGLMSIDPAVSPEAVCHPAASYRQMRMLAKAGAQVLHPYCVEPVCEAGIPTILKNTFAPGKPGTYISDHVRKRVPCVCAQSGYAVAQLDELAPDCRRIAEGLAAEIFADAKGRAMVVLKQPSKEPVCIVSAFGLSSRLQDEARLRIKPLAELHNEHCSKFIVRDETAADAQRTLHALLMTTASRTPSSYGEPYRSAR